MKELFAIYLESLDQELQVFLNEDEANARAEELKKAGKPVKIQKFGDWQIQGVSKSNGTAADDPEFWEELIYDNGKYLLTEHFCWHQAPDEEGYYPDYDLNVKM